MVQAQWRCAKYSMQLMCAPSLAFTLAWRDMDSLFDRLHEWRDAPIDLRHPFCFYYGHVVSFAKIKMLQVSHSTRWQPSARPAHSGIQLMACPKITYSCSPLCLDNRL